MEEEDGLEDEEWQGHGEEGEDEEDEEKKVHKTEQVGLALTVEFPHICRVYVCPPWFLIMKVLRLYSCNSVSKLECCMLWLED